jgi:hypothetical protein
MNFKFAASPNTTNLEIGNITGIVKKGWDWVWSSFEKEVDGTAHAMVARPTHAYVHKIYKTSDFSTLGIGTT